MLTKMLYNKIFQTAPVLGVTCYICYTLHNIITFLLNKTKYAIKTSKITQVTLLTNVTGYPSNEVTVMNLLSNFITSNKVTNLII